ncbi:MAG: hypothetical protein R3279_08765 [Putridiphycobacter sp.]|nr:hypothetical protein [Putridiphycobacter sp.]
MIKHSILIFFTCISVLAISQTDKQVQKAVKTYHKNASKGIKKLEKYIGKASGYGNNNGWETLIKMEYSQYNMLKELFEGMSISVENEEASDSMNAFTANVMKNTFLENNEKGFVNICRQASIMSTSSLADYYIRKLRVDVEPDTLISDTAKAYFEEGEAFFIKEDFELAKLNYRKAIAEDDNYYKAVLYLGDAFWREENYDSAIYYFSIAKELQPNLLEPRKYLIDALMGKSLYERAKTECLDAFCVYPSYGIKYRYMDILKIENKWLYTRNIKRDFFANNMTDSTQGSLLPPFNAYREGKYDKNRQYNIDGIATGINLSTDRYLEVNSWRLFLEKHKDNLPELFRFAQKMNKDDYLDCYIFFTFFHIDIYPQFQDFMSSEKNRERMKFFITEYLVDEY